MLDHHCFSGYLMLTYNNLKFHIMNLKYQLVWSHISLLYQTYHQSSEEKYLRKPVYFRDTVYIKRTNIKGVKQKLGILLQIIIKIVFTFVNFIIIRVKKIRIRIDKISCSVFIRAELTESQ